MKTSREFFVMSLNGNKIFVPKGAKCILNKNTNSTIYAWVQPWNNIDKDSLHELETRGIGVLKDEIMQD